MSKLPSLTELLKAGVHFGHRESHSHPKAQPYVYTVSSGVQVIDLAETRRELAKAVEFVEKLAQEGKTILFLGTKPQAKRIIEKAAKEAELPYVTNRWIGGTITNFEMVSKQIKKLNKMIKDSEGDAWDKYTKKERLDLQRESEKLDRRVGGIKDIKKIPDAIFIVDCKREKNAFAEAVKRRVPMIALVDTNINPDKIAYPVPANDDGVKSIELIVETLAKAYLGAKK